MSSAFDRGVAALDEACRTWHKGGSPGLLSQAAVAFDELARVHDVRGEVGAAFARGLAGDLVGARRRLAETITRHPREESPYVALATLLLRAPDPLAHATEAAHALVAARDLAPAVLWIERSLAIALSAQGQFMGALQSARAALTIDATDLDARLWSGMLRLYFGGDSSAAATLVELAGEFELQLRSPAGNLAAVAGHYARAEYHEARMALRRAIAPLKVGNVPEAPLVDAARRWFREVRGFGAGQPMVGERWLRDVGGATSDYVRTRSALATLREECTRDPARAAADGVDPIDVEGAAVELEARTRRGMLEWGAKLIIRGFADAYLPLSAYLEAPPLEACAAMGLVVLDG